MGEKCVPMYCMYVGILFIISGLPEEVWSSNNHVLEVL